MLLSGTSLLYSLYCSFLFNKFTFLRNKNDRKLRLTLSKIGIYHPPSIACASLCYLAYVEKNKNLLVRGNSIYRLTSKE